MKVEANFKNFVMNSIVFVGVDDGAKTILGAFAIDKVIELPYLSSAADSLGFCNALIEDSSRQPSVPSTDIFLMLKGQAYAFKTAIIKRFKTSSGIGPKLSSIDVHTRL